MIAVIAVAQPASAGVYVFDSEEEAHEFVLELAEDLSMEDYWAGDKEGLLDSCTDYRPECYAVSLQHCSGGSCSWTVITDIDWNSTDERYEICIDENFALVDGVKGYWRTTAADACDYCNQGGANPDWDPNYQDIDDPDPDWMDMTEEDDCQPIGWPSWDIVYWGKEIADPTDWDYGTGKFIRWDKIPGSAYNSRVDLKSCPD